MTAKNWYFQKRVLRRLIRWIRAGLYSPLGALRFFGVPLPVSLAYGRWACRCDRPLRDFFIRLGAL